MDIGAPELIIVLIIVVLIFGVGRIGKIGSELGKSIKEFRQGIADDKATTSTGTPAASAPVVEPEPAALVTHKA